MKKVTVNGTVVLHQHYLYRGYLQIVALDLTRSNAPALWYLHWDPTQPVATRPLSLRKNGTWYTYGHDLTKNVTELYKADGTIATAYDYTPYGSVTASGIDQPIQWSSEHYDPELALVYYNYRHYNPLDGRWINRDPIAEEGGRNLYGFVNNRLVDRYDSEGKEIIIIAEDPIVVGFYQKQFTAINVLLDQFIAQIQCLSEEEFDQLSKEGKVRINDKKQYLTKEQFIQLINKEKKSNAVSCAADWSLISNAIQSNLNRLTEDYDHLLLVLHGNPRTNQSSAKVNGRTVSSDIIGNLLDQLIDDKGTLVSCGYNEDNAISRVWIIKPTYGLLYEDKKNDSDDCKLRKIYFDTIKFKIETKSQNTRSHR